MHLRCVKPRGRRYCNEWSAAWASRRGLEGLSVVDSGRTIVYEAGAVVDAAGTDARPGAVAVRGGVVVAAGEVRQVHRIVGAKPDATVRLADKVMLPPLVNAHAHLDMTAIGPQCYDGNFSAWLWRITEARPTSDDQIGRAVRRGVEMSRAAGVGIVGDIANSPAAVRARAATGLGGVSYIECFGQGRTAVRAIEKLDAMLAQLPVEQGDVHVGITPHAPYAVAHDLYAHSTASARQHAYRLCTHLAETPDEIEFTRDGTGMFADHLKRWGVWDDSITGSGMHPVDWFEPHLRAGQWLLAHCNYVEDEHIALLAECDASVAYCPTAGQYFGHPRNPRPPRQVQHRKQTEHRYRDMLDAGVNVCLGTDSIVCQPPDEPQPLGIVPQMRLLYQRDGVDPRRLLKMATVNGARGLGIDAAAATLRPGLSRAQVVAVRFDPDDPADALTQVLKNRYPVEPVDLMTQGS